MNMLEDLRKFLVLVPLQAFQACVCVLSIHYGQPTCSECLVWNFKSTTIICFKSATSNQHQLTSNQHQLTNQSNFVLSQTEKKTVVKPFISPWVALLAAGRCRIARRVSACGFGPVLPDTSHRIRRSFRADDPWLAMVTGDGG